MTCFFTPVDFLFRESSPQKASAFCFHKYKDLKQNKTRNEISGTVILLHVVSLQLHRTFLRVSEALFTRPRWSFPGHNRIEETSSHFGVCVPHVLKYMESNSLGKSGNLQRFSNISDPDPKQYTWGMEHHLLLNKVSILLKMDWQ